MKPRGRRLLIEKEDVVKEEKTSSGILLLKSDYSLYQFDDDNLRVEEMIQKIKQNKGIIRSIGDDCVIGLVPREKIIYKKGVEITSIKENDTELALVDEKDILAKVKEDALTIAPDYVLIKISKESREALFTKKIRRNDGSVIDLVIQIPPDKDEDKYSQLAVSCGEIMQVGANIQNVQCGDIAILDYKTDNDDTIIVGYEGEDKLIAVYGQTTRYESDYIIPENRKNKRPQIVWQRGDYEHMSELLGVVRGNQLISRDPYIFLNHENTLIEKATLSGIIYTVDEKILEREILAISEESKKRFGGNIKEGDKVLVDDFDIFTCQLDDRKISCVNDVDIMAKVLQEPEEGQFPLLPL